MRRFIAFLFAVFLLSAAGASALTLKPAPVYPDRYWKMDVRSSSKLLPSHYRTMPDEFPAGSQELLPSREGMDTLCISGSAQYSAKQLEGVISDIRERTDAEICVFDLRQETHGFVNGEAVSLYANKNRGNVGHGTQEVLLIEARQLGELKDTELTFEQRGSGGMKKPGEKQKTGGGTDPEQTVKLAVTDVMTEAQLCEALGVRYVRIACTDMVRPEDEQVDEFLEAYKNLPEGTWLHFHCALGVGRTGIFMMMADMIRNPEVPLDDIITRQALLGAQDPRKSDQDENIWKANLLAHFHEYVAACGPDGYETSFSEWASVQDW